MASFCPVTKLPCPASELTGRTCSQDAGVEDVAACAAKLIEMNIALKNDVADLEEYIQFLKNGDDVDVPVD